jgi:hypothetical protein
VGPTSSRFCAREGEGVIEDEIREQDKAGRPFKTFD